VKLYRQIERGETLQAGDEHLSDHPSQWYAVDEADYGPVNDKHAVEYRRPVDAVPLGKFQELEAALSVTYAARKVLMHENEELRQLLKRYKMGARLFNDH